MKTSSCKAKGRRLQQEVRDLLLEILKPYGIEEGDIQSVAMGQSGEDLILSPAAKRILNLSIECKNRETLVVPTVFIEHYEKYRDDPSLKLLVHARNRSNAIAKEVFPLVTLRLSDFALLLNELVQHENTRKIGFNTKKRK